MRPCLVLVSRPASLITFHHELLPPCLLLITSLLLAWVVPWGPHREHRPSSCSQHLISLCFSFSRCEMTPDNGSLPQTPWHSPLCRRQSPFWRLSSHFSFTCFKTSSVWNYIPSTHVYCIWLFSSTTFLQDLSMYIAILCSFSLPYNILLHGRITILLCVLLLVGVCGFPPSFGDWKQHCGICGILWWLRQ